MLNRKKKKEKEKRIEVRRINPQLLTSFLAGEEESLIKNNPQNVRVKMPPVFTKFPLNHHYREEKDENLLRQKN